MNAHFVSPQSSSGSSTARLCFFLAAIIAVHVALRLPHIGHLLSWDEAMNILTVRSHAAQVNDEYAAWFSRHPPTMAVILSLLRPFAGGFAARAEFFSLLVSIGTLLALFAVARESFGERTAFLAGACFAVMPGAVFFDTWIKQDGLVALFGLIAIFFWLRRRALPSGIFIGVCCLAKENAVFYAGALFILWFFERPWNARSLAAIVLAPLLIAGWWYVFFSTAVADQFSFATGVKIHQVENWDKPWWYFLGKLRLDLGWPGVALAITGIAVCGATRRSAGADAAVCATNRIWPLAVILPGYALLTLMAGKAPWLNIALLPALAMIQAVAIGFLLRFIQRPFQSMVFAMLLTITLLPSARMDHEQFMQKQDYGTWRGANASRAAALELNRLVEPGARVLITPMWYWPEEQHAPCPIFACYIKPLDVLIKPNTITAAELIAAVRENRLDWAMVAPPPGEGEQRLIAPLIRDQHLKPVIPDGNMNAIFYVRPLRAETRGTGKTP